MTRREKLHEKLVALIDSRNVYFQPPPKFKMKHPCIVYSRNTQSTDYADNILYRSKQGYSLTVIDPNPDSVILEKVSSLPLCSFDRHYTSDNLNHDVYNIFY